MPLRHLLFRRVPKHAVNAYGPFIRQVLSKCPKEAEAYAKRLGDLLEDSWSNTIDIIPIDVIALVTGFKHGQDCSLIT